VGDASLKCCMFICWPTTSQE